MKVTKSKVVTVVGFIVSSLFLFTSSCSLEKKTSDDSTLKQTEKQSPQEKTKKEIFVANQFCAACHYGFGNEELARTHERAGIGCERCHGEDLEHGVDDSNFCANSGCHDREWPGLAID